MTLYIDPKDAPKDGQRVAFFFENLTVDRPATAVFDSASGKWIGRDSYELDISAATAAQVIGFDPE